MSKKELTIDFSLYKDELNKQFNRGYNSAFYSLSKFLISSDKQNADIYLAAIDAFCVDNELFEELRDIQDWYEFNIKGNNE